LAQAGCAAGALGSRAERSRRALLRPACAQRPASALDGVKERLNGRRDRSSRAPGDVP